ncbi:MAG TPA: aspartate-semialdehyde dehydrogenase, partial [Planctomycetes bacterium]|nr:aspartate-semialdehyde dehydrogenase [Planctomycetota bacterium]
GAAVSLWTEAPLSVEEARAALEATPWIRLVDQPTPRQVAGRDEVLVGRLRRAPGSTALQFFEVSDNLRRGAATNAMHIACLLFG